jgi:hypothetical protein
MLGSPNSAQRARHQAQGLAADAREQPQDVVEVADTPLYFFTCRRLTSVVIVIEKAVVEHVT